MTPQKTMVERGTSSRILRGASSMRLIIGFVTIVACVIGGYMAMGGHLVVLVQPFEALIILGAAIGAFVIGNTGPVLKQSLGVFGTLFRGPRYNKSTYVELLGLQFSLFKLVQSKGVLALEPHIENPKESPIFTRFPKFAANHHAVEFMCDYLRMVTLGTNNVHEMEALMDEELETHHQENARLVTAIQSLADGTRRSASSPPCSASSTPWARSASRPKCSAT